LKNECKPKWFVLENVASMPKKDRDIITREMGVEPVMFNASLVSAQSRKRLFWTNIPFELPADRGVVLKDILEQEVDAKFFVDKVMTTTPNKKPGEFVQVGYFGAENQCKVGGTALRVYDAEAKAPTLASVGHLVKLGHIGGSDAQANRVYDTQGKSVTLSAQGGGLGAKTGLYETGDKIRKLTPIECERLQGLPDNYTEGVATTNRYKCLGNAFNVDVVTHILAGLRHVP
jgi:DNA (cytosine-5)-methyltransferase 3A